MGKPYISVVVPTWNEEKYIGRTLRSLRRQSLPRSEYEIIVVDGHSKDGTVRIARRYADKVLLENKGSIGYARNLGAKRARGEVVAFIDADSIAPMNWLMRIKKIFRRPWIRGVGGMAVPIGGRLRDKMTYAFLNWYWKTASWLGMYQFVGFNCAYRRKDFLRAGGFSPDVRFLEDVEFSFRFRKQGKCKLSRRLKVYTSPRRFVQQGVLKQAWFCIVGYACMALNKPFPWDYAHSIEKGKRPIDK